MKFTKEEISLCKQMAERHRKPIRKYSWWYGDDEKGLHMCLVDGLLPAHDRIPLWTISDCLEFLREKGWLLSSFFEILKELKISSRGWRPKVSCMFWKPKKSRFALSPNHEGGCGYTPLEACLRAVLAVLEEK